MAILLSEASAYIELNVIDIEDWQDADESKKRRILNTAQRIINDKFPEFVIPVEAIYLFAPVLAGYFNDMNRLQRYDVASYGITGVMSVTYKQCSLKEPYEMIPRESLEVIGKANDVKLTGKSPIWMVM